MEKITKEAFRKALDSPILDCTENEIRFAFNILQLSLKELSTWEGGIEFEVHWRRTYIIKITVGENIISFSNEWMRFNEQEGRLAFECPDKLVEIIALMFFLFGEPIFNNIGYGPGYIEGYSYMDSMEEGQEYWDIMHSMIKTANSSHKVKSLAPEVKAPSKKDFPTLRKGNKNFS